MDFPTVVLVLMLVSNMRGFSLLEMVLAFALAGIALTTGLVVALGLPVAARNLDLKVGAISLTRTLLHDGLYTGNVTATTSGAYSSSVSFAEDEDEAFTLVRSSTLWKDASGLAKTTELVTHIASDDTSNPCDDFVEKDWSSPVVRASHALLAGQALPLSLPDGSYDVSSLAASSSTLAVTVGSTTDPVAPTLLIFSARGTNPSLTYVDGFDNASTSRIGFSSVSLSHGYVFAGNGFGSRGAPTCADGISCAQIQVFSLSGESRRLASLQLSTSSPPFAITSSGATASASSVFYHLEYLYVGLEKTVGGDEFNILDVHDPAHPSWLSGMTIGRTVSSITVRGDTAYVSTDDPSGELVVIDVTDPQHPVKLGMYNAPGATGFGYGASLKIRDGIVRFGRSYSPDGAEFEILDARNPAHIISLQENDIGTSKDPESLRSMASMDTLTFALFTNRLLFIDTRNNEHPAMYANPYTLPQGSTGVSLSCRGNLLYVARKTATGSVIDVLSSS
jgi:type II secretory pathway pseudopilin PulG